MELLLPCLIKPSVNIPEMIIKYYMRYGLVSL